MSQKDPQKIEVYLDTSGYDMEGVSYSPIVGMSPYAGEDRIIVDNPEGWTEGTRIVVPIHSVAFVRMAIPE